MDFNDRKYLMESIAEKEKALTYAKYLNECGYWIAVNDQDEYTESIRFVIKAIEKILDKEKEKLK